ncbi:MAG: hypothetical protein ACK4N5_05330 [Myxococcales bacterium]
MGAVTYQPNGGRRVRRCTDFSTMRTVCYACGAPAKHLCDHGSPTCDASLCSEHATVVGPNKHHCPEHRNGGVA